MHKHSPISADRALMRDLVALQRSRSLRDPSASPPSVVEMLSKKGEKGHLVQEGRRSVGSERRKKGRRLVASSPPLATFGMSRVALYEANGEYDGFAAMSEARDARRIRREETSQKINRSRALGVVEESPLHQNAYDLTHDTIFRNSGSKRIFEEAAVSIRGNCSGLSRVKRGRRKRGARRSRASLALRDIGAHNDLSMASYTVDYRSAHSKYHMKQDKGEDEYEEKNVTRANGNGCGIPWNWSRIHNRGKSFLDIAGRSFACGMSDLRFKKGGLGANGGNISDIYMASDNSSCSTKYDNEAKPLLVDASVSQESTRWKHGYSGELGIYADNLFKNDVYSNDASEARYGDQHKSRGHQNMTQKYMPKTFRDIVGQNLVVQALSNAVMRKKVGLLYVFYGPHGTGKTSCARIFATALNCQSLDHPKPCGLCNSCIAHDAGKSRNIKEVGPVSNFEFESLVDVLDTAQHSSQHRVFIFDDCDTLSQQYWSAISKVIDRAPRRVVFVLVCPSLDVLPHIIVSRCQKFFFPKLKDADIIYTLQWIASKDDIEIDKDALKLIASRSDGSLRDAEMTLEQLSLLGHRINIPLVRELVGLISDERLVDLLDLALSADTVNTVKNLRVIMESGVEPLALVSQLATVITDILAGSYDYTKEGRRRKFFRHQPCKVSLAHVIQQAEGYSQQNGWSQRRAVSIAEKLEQDNLRLESQSRSLICWKASKGARRKPSRLKVRARRPPTHSLLKLVSCGKCLTSKSPR